LSARNRAPREKFAKYPDDGRRALRCAGQAVHRTRWQRPSGKRVIFATCNGGVARLCGNVPLGRERIAGASRSAAGEADATAPLPASAARWRIGRGICRTEKLERLSIYPETIALSER
jgi:hypothetical protein